MSGQLALPFDPRSAFGRADFIAGPSNETALRFLDAWPEWPARAAAIHGPAGCGKTHLAELWRAASGGVRLPVSALSLDLVGRLAPDENVAIEDIDRVQPTRTRDDALIALFERRAGVVLLTGRTSPAAWGVVLPDIGSRFKALLTFEIRMPDDVMLSALAHKHFADRQLDVPESVIQRMLVALERSPASIANFIADLDRRALADRRAITERLVLELLTQRECSQA